MRPLVSQISANLPPASTTVLAALYEKQPATPDQLSQRTGLAPERVQAALEHLRELGILRSGPHVDTAMAKYVWLDLVPTLLLQGKQAPMEVTA